MESVPPGPSFHRAFGLAIRSSRRIPELEVAEEGEPDLEIRFLEAAPPADPGPGDPPFLPLLYDEPESPWASVRRLPDRFEVRFHGVADFRCDGGARRVDCLPHPGVPEETVRHMLLDNLLPCLLSHRGRLALHGSMAAVPGGAAVFVGWSGVGKSTLAAAFAARDGIYLGDDSAVLDPAPGGLLVVPAYPDARLHPEQGAALGLGRPRLPVAHNSRKGRFGVGGMGAAFARDPLPLRRLYLLPDYPGDRISIEGIPAPDALVQLLHHSYRLDPEDRGRMEEQFRILSRPDLLSRVRRLRIPAGTDRIGEVLDAIENDCR